MKRETDLNVIEGKLREARLDVNACIEVWREIIKTRLSNRINYAILKGSATKNWESYVDYVPVISDLDIHIGTKKDQPLFPTTRDGFLFAVETTKQMEQMYLNLRPQHTHIPRPQIVIIKSEQEDWLPEKTDTVTSLFGETPYKPLESVESLRSRDLHELQNLSSLLERLPELIIDRIDLEYYRVLRMLCYVVSPSPVRVLCQVHGDPKWLWSLNRTRIIEELRKYGFDQIADAYSCYYLAGWEAFLSDFRDNEAMRKVLTCAYNVLDNCHEALRKLKQFS
jgi:hypothetical protein